MFNSYQQNTLQYDQEKCTNCGMCSIVCPHRVFARGDAAAVMVRPQDCMECGACRLNCPSGAIDVESGVGCAYAMIRAALTGGEETCDCGCSGNSTEGSEPEGEGQTCCCNENK